MTLKDLDTSVLTELVEEQLKMQGCGCVRVDDGQVFIFNEKLLTELAKKASDHKDGLAMVFVTTSQPS